MQALYDALPPGQRGEWARSSDRMAACARRLLDAGDVAVVKGSLGSRMGVIVEAIKGLGEARPAGEEA
jgi:UDP-N-acetylmuramoyl-tripeptide--D-alanyl-D-alanine ligase